MFPPLASPRSGSKSQHLMDAISASSTGPPTFLAHMNFSLSLYQFMGKKEY